MRQVRNYDSPAPARVVSNISTVLRTGNMELLEKGAYNFLITHCGFIAHFDQAGFIATYKNDMVDFVAFFLSQRGQGWDAWLENRSSYLYDVTYRGKPIADIIRELIPVFLAYQPAIEAAHKDRQTRLSEALMRRLADELGYDLVKRRKEQQAA